MEAENEEEFSPAEVLGPALFSQIHTLPESISKLKNVKKVWLYGSSLKSIPPEIGEMASLEYFDPYTSYDLHWFPYEIIRCKNLKQSRVSTRALYGNYKNRMGFPNLKNNPVRYFGNTVRCSVCNKEMSYNDTNQLWITAQVATDVLPLLANLCSRECEGKLLSPPEGYVQFPHKGGADLEQPKTSEREHLSKMGTKLSAEDIERRSQESKQGTKLLTLIRKIWEK